MGHRFRQLVICVLILSFVMIPVWGGTSASAKPHEVIPAFFEKVNSRCSELLTTSVPPVLHTPLKVAGHIVPIIPVFRTLANRDKFFFIFFENPTIGLVVTPLAAGTSDIMVTGEVALTEELLGRASENYMAYHSANVVLSGNTINEALKARTKILMNWWYSTLFFTIFTAGSRLAAAQTLEEQAFAYGLVTYSALWPALNQMMSQFIFMPLLYSKFPRAGLLQKLKDSGFSKEELKTEEQQRIVTLETELVKATDKHEKQKLKNEIKLSQSNLKWIDWFRDGISDGTPLPVSRRVQYWAYKAAIWSIVGVGVTTLYFLLRSVIAGDQPDDHTLIQRTFEDLLRSEPKPSTPNLTPDANPDQIPELASDLADLTMAFKDKVRSGEIPLPAL